MPADPIAFDGLADLAALKAASASAERRAAAQVRMLAAAAATPEIAGGDRTRGGVTVLLALSAGLLLLI